MCIRDRLEVYLTNPDGTQALVFDGAATPTGAPEVFLEGVPVMGFPGDESVNGTWTLRVVDDAFRNAGVLRSFGLDLISRYD